MPSKSWGSVKIYSSRHSREQVIEQLRERLRSLDAELSLRRVVLFGSYAQGNFTAFSDIDVLVVYADPPRPDAFAVAKTRLGLRGLQPHVLAESEYAAVRDVWERMTRQSVVLWEKMPTGRSSRDEL